MLRELPALLLFLFPLTASPGPANLLLAAAGASFGFRKTAPFLVGIYLVLGLQSLVVGSGLGELIGRYPSALRFFQFTGAAYLVYLGYHFFRASKIDEQNTEQLGFREGAIMQSLNFKALVVHLLMFTQFLDPAEPAWPQIIFLTLTLVIIGAGSGLIWLAGGNTLGRLLRTEKGAAWQGRIFGTMLFAVALWMVFRHSS